MKIGQLYNFDSIKRLIAQGGHQRMQDSAAGIVLARNLTHVDPQIFRKQYPELAFMNSGIDVDNRGGFAERVQSLRIQEQGSFKPSRDRTTAKGRISIAGEQSTLAVAQREAEATWTDSEVETAKLQNINLVSEYLEAYNMQFNRELDEIGYLGIAEEPGSEGLLNHSDIVAVNATDSIDNLSSQGMYDEIAEFLTDQHSGVNNTPAYMATRLDLPTRVYNVIARQTLNTAAGPMTVLRALETNFPGVQFRQTFRGDDGSLAASASVAYSINREAMLFRVPEQLTIGEIVRVKSFTHSMEGRYRCAGLDLLERSAARIINGL